MKAKLNFIDKSIGYFSPRMLADRARSRFVAEQIQYHLEMSARRYEGAAKTKRTTGWRADGRSANTDTEFDLTTLMHRSRDLSKNNPLAKRAVSIIVSNAIGTGILANFAPKAGIELNEKEKARVKNLWDDFAGSTVIDADGTFDFFGQQAMAVRGMVDCGFSFARRRYREVTKENPLGFQVQLLEADFLDRTKNENRSDGTRIIQGIEFDSRGTRLAYHFYLEHPGDARSLTGLKTVRVPAKDVIQLYRPSRIGAVLDVPWGSAAIIKIRDFEDYQDATLLRQKIAACFTMVVTNPDASSGSGLIQSRDSSDVLPEKVGPGEIIETGPGQEVQFGSPPGADGSSNFDRQTLRMIAIAYDVPAATLTGDLSDVNFSSGRMGWLEFQRNLEQWRWHIIIPQFCNGVHRWFVEAATVAGHGYVKNYNPVWTPPSREMIDPVAETNATLKQIRGGLMSRSAAIRQRGEDPEHVHREIQEDNATADKMKLVFDSDPRRVSAIGFAQAKDPLGSEKGNVDDKGSEG